MLVTDGQYRDGDIVLVRARWWLRPWARYDHAALLWRYPGTTYTVEAGMSGVRAWKWAHWPREFDVFRPDGADFNQGMMAAALALQELGTRYAFEHLPAVLWRIIRRPVTLQAVVCTELVTWAWQQAGVELCPGVRVPTPDDIWEAVR